MALLRRALPPLAIVLAVGVGAAAVLDGEDDGPGGAADPGGSEQASVKLPPRTRLFGFSDQTFAYTGRPDRSLDQGVTATREQEDAFAAGANSHRLIVPWWGVEPRPGMVDRRYVAQLRAFADRVEGRGGRVLVTLLSPPPWASAKPGDPRATIAAGRPDLVRAFGRYAGFVARTFPRAAAIETWNEPNTTYFWAPGAPDPELYVRLHRAALRAIRSAAPRMPVLFGGLLGTSAREDRDVMSPGRFMRRAFRAGLTTREYQGLSFHPYPVQKGGEMQPLDGGHFAAQFADFRSAYRSRDPRAPVWLTETGVTTSGPAAVSPEFQAGALTRLVRKLLSMPDVAAVYVHTLYEPAGRPATSQLRGFGLLKAAGAAPGKPKPAFCALRALRRRQAPRFDGCPR